MKRHSGSNGERSLQLGVDVGGTFTDLVVLDSATGQIRTVKTFTTPDDPSRGFVEAIDLSGAPLASPETLVTHGSTIAINTVVTRSGARVGFLTTHGHRDLLDIGRALREEGHLYDATWQRPHVERPIVPRFLRRTVRERILADGSILWPLDENDLRRAVDELRAEGVSTIAICFLNAYVNATHERRAREVIRDHWPDVGIELSSDVAPVPREYDRAITLALNAYVSPIVGSYLERITDELRDRDYGRDLYVMQSNGGLATSEIVRELPVSTLLSGPVAGVLGAQYLGQMLGIDNVLTFDMGGTTTDVAAITDGELTYAKRHEVEWDIYSVLPMVEINSVGQGGGSIAWRDSAGALRVGPQSAGAYPGPACYGRGGTAATITDSNLLRGILWEDTFAGGDIPLSLDAAESSIGELAEELRADAKTVAQGIYDIANANMIEAIRGVTIYKGIDPREYSLVCFGSAGGQHVSAIAAELGIRRIVVPEAPGTFAAFGLSCTDLKVDLTASVMRELDAMTDDDLAEAFLRLEAKGLAALEMQGASVATTITQRFVEGCYGGQTWETLTKAPGGPVDESFRAELLNEFHGTHERLWAFRAEELPVMILNARVSMVAPVEKPRFRRLPSGTGATPDDAVLFRRSVFLGSEGPSLDVPFIARENLRANDTVEGPAAVLERTSTTLLLKGDLCQVDAFGNLHIFKEAL